MTDEYAEETLRLGTVIYDYDLPLGVMINAWAAWCKLFDAKEAAEKVQADACKVHAL